MITVGELFIYPIKSLGGIQVNTVQLTKRGFENDRRWMLVDENNIFLTQRQFAQMALLQTAIVRKSIEIFHNGNPSNKISLPLFLETGETVKVKVWDDTCEAIVAADELNKWFGKQLQINCRLVYMPESSLREVDKNYVVHADDITSFSDGYPILMIAAASLTDLNQRMQTSIPANRFRPNMIVNGVKPFEEDSMNSFAINGLPFYGVNPCSRCVVTTINQHTAQKNKEPLKTLATYRMKDNKIFFGQNVIGPDSGTISTGDRIIITKQENS